jgi:hypothetical protein
MRQDRDDDVAGLGIQLLDVPVARVQDPRARVYIVDHLNPGTTIHRRVEVRNTSPDPQHVELYAGGAVVEGNAFTGLDKGHGANELSGWVSLEAASVDLPPGGKKPVQVTVAVPSAASRGERYAAVWAQITSAPVDGSNVAQIHRVGIRMYLDVGLGGEPPTDFKIDGLAVGPGPGEWPVVTARVHNTGERALDMTGTLSLSNESGSVRAGPFSVVTGVTILPGQSGQVGAPVTQSLPAGRWDVRLTLVSGTVQRTVDGRITLPVADTRAAKSLGPGWLALSLGAGAVLALVIVLFAWHLVRRRRGRSGGQPEPLS